MVFVASFVIMNKLFFGTSCSSVRIIFSLFCRVEDGDNVTVCFMHWPDGLGPESRQGYM